jgi:tRNA(His) 5'-end guanylyltransferase
MKFDKFDEKMRVFETALDYRVLPGIYMVARLDGRTFTRLTKEVYQFEAPYDTQFREYMIDTITHLMNCGFRVTYAYTQSDEISLLFPLEEDTFKRKMRKYNSILAGEASAKFSLLLGQLGTFDCRISQLPTAELVCDYFLWRQEDAHRNALNSHCYWLLRKNGKSVQGATTYLSGMSVSAKHELLFSYGVNFNDLPNWQKKGVGLYWEEYEKQGINPLLGQPVNAVRKRLKVQLDLPMKEEYRDFLLKLT